MILTPVTTIYVTPSTWSSPVRMVEWRREDLGHGKGQKQTLGQAGNPSSNLFTLWNGTTDPTNFWGFTQSNDLNGLVSSGNVNCSSSHAQYNIKVGIIALSISLSLIFLNVDESSGQKEVSNLLQCTSHTLVLPSMMDLHLEWET